MNHIGLSTVFPRTRTHFPGIECVSGAKFQMSPPPFQIHPVPVAVPDGGLRRLLPPPHPQPGRRQRGQGRRTRGRGLVGRVRSHLRALAAMVSIGIRCINLNDSRTFLHH